VIVFASFSNFTSPCPAIEVFSHNIVARPVNFLLTQEGILKMGYSDTTTTTTGWDEFDLPDHTDSSLITDISRGLDYMSGESRKKRHRQKLIDELVREHIDGKQQREGGRKAKSKLQAMYQKFLYRK
jgi:hypothetical protein